MKTVFLISFAALMSFTSFSQTDPSKNIPPLKMHPKNGEVKSFYELPSETEYKIFNQKGELIESGKGKWIESTGYVLGTYFIQYEGKTESLVIKGQTDPSKNIPPMKMLPKNGEVKSFYELPSETDYKIFNQKGELIKSDKGKWIETTDYVSGTYFIQYEGKTESLAIKE